MRRLALTLALTLGAATTAAGLGPLSAYAGATTGVCAGVTHCRVVAHDDVDGDFDNDAIALQQGPGRAVTVRVLTHTGTLLTRRVSVGAGHVADRWGGAAGLDSTDGDELLVLTSLTGGTRGYTVLRYHAGALHHEAAPDGEARWTIARHRTPLLGWHQFFTDVSGMHMIRSRTVRSPHGGYTAFRTVYAWRHGAWVRLGAGSTTHYPGRQGAVHTSGFHVMGLARVPAS